MAMRGRLLDLSIGFNQKQRLTVELDHDFRETFDQLKEAELDIEIKKHRRRRSLDANAYAWVLIDKIASAMRISKVQVYRDAIRDIGGVSEVVCMQDEAVERFCRSWEANGLGCQTETIPSKISGCTNVIVYFGSSTYDTRQMSTLIDRLIQDAKALGIETMTPAELGRLAGYTQREEADIC